MFLPVYIYDHSLVWYGRSDIYGMLAEGAGRHRLLPYWDFFESVYFSL